MKNKDNRLGGKRSLPSLHITVVTFDPCLDTLSKTFNGLNDSIIEAVKFHKLGDCSLSVIDNGPEKRWQRPLTAMLDELKVKNPSLTTHLFSDHGNIGYGCGHNLAAKTKEVDFLLVLNPDAILKKDTLCEALNFMGNNKDVGLLTPNVTNESGNREFTCKRYPSVAILGLRGFASRLMKDKFHTQIAHYEMHDLYASNTPVFGIPLVSGCFMFCRYDIWQKLGGFSEKYFMYFEDFDLSLRMGEVTKTAYVPTVAITHLGGGAARKGWRHIWMFVRSGLTFFGQHGWKIW